MSNNKVKMNCNSCGNTFNKEKHMPRLLIKCGHSFCSHCIDIEFNQGCIECLSCGVINYAEFPDEFPSNLTLLDINENQLSNLSISETTKRNVLVAKSIDFDQSSIKDSQQNVIYGKKYIKTEERIPASSCCIEHGKAYEAFCLNDKTLLCIQCLLEKKHDNHAIIEIKAAFERAKIEFSNRVDKLEVNEKCLLDNYKEDIKTSLDTLNKHHKDSVDLVEIQFGELFNLINKRKKDVIAKLK